MLVSVCDARELVRLNWVVNCSDLAPFWLGFAASVKKMPNLGFMYLKVALLANLMCVGEMTHTVSHFDVVGCACILTDRRPPPSLACTLIKPERGSTHWYHDTEIAESGYTVPDCTCQQYCGGGGGGGLDAL